MSPLPPFAPAVPKPPPPPPPPLSLGVLAVPPALPVLAPQTERPPPEPGVVLAALASIPPRIDASPYTPRITGSVPAMVSVTPALMVSESMVRSMVATVPWLIEVVFGMIPLFQHAGLLKVLAEES